MSPASTSRHVVHLSTDEALYAALSHLPPDFVRTADAALTAWADALPPFDVRPAIHTDNMGCTAPLHHLENSGGVL